MNVDREVIVKARRLADALRIELTLEPIRSIAWEVWEALGSALNEDDARTRG